MTFTLYVLIVNFVLLILLITANVYLYKKFIFKMRQKIRAQERELDIAHVRISEVAQLKADIVSLAAHQMRSPLVAINGYTSMINEGDFGNVQSTIKDAVDHIAEASQKLMQMANEFLDISKLQDNKIEYSMQDFDIEHITHNVYDEFKEVAKKKKLEFYLNYDHDKKYKVFADAEKIRRVIWNIVDNALKYTQKGSVKIQIDNIDGKVRVAVKDTGIGISAEDKERLFHKFSRTSQANEIDVTGTGLGLYIAKRIIMAQGGNVWVTSSGPGNGSMFIIELPAKE